MSCERQNDNNPTIALTEGGSLAPGEYTFGMTLKKEDRPSQTISETRIDFSVL